MAVNVDIKRKGSENPMSMLRRFRNRLRSSGALNRARALRYHDRSVSPYVKKKNRLRTIKKSQEHERLYKLGKITDK